MKKEINPLIAVVVIVAIVAIIGIVGFNRATGRKVDSWETTPQEVKDKIGQAYGARPAPPPQTP